MSRRAIAFVLLLPLAACSRSCQGSAASAPAVPTKGRLSLRAKLGRELILSALQETLVVPESIQREQRALLALPDTGLVRLVERGLYEGIEEPRGGGCYYSFATRDHSYNREPDVELQQGRYSTSFYGGTTGYVWDIGSVDLASIDDDLASMPKGLPSSEKEKWEYFQSDAKAAARDYDRAFDESARKLGFARGGVPALAGHTYLLRAVMPGEHDHLVAFTTLTMDEEGHTLAWRILKRWNVPKR